MEGDVWDIDRMPSTITIGIQTENGVSPVYISVRRWIDKWGDMDFSVWHAIPGCDSAYQAQSHMEGDVLVWDVTDSDTMRCGKGKVIIMGTLPSGERKLSATRNTAIFPSVPMRRDWYPPENQQPWFVTALEATRKAQKAQKGAEKAADKYPKIGANGHWFLWDVDQEKYVDSGVDVAVVVTDQVEGIVDQYMQDHPFDGVTQEELTEAVDAALQEAKDSGEFDGAPGADGAKGDKGDPGQDGQTGAPGSPGRDATCSLLDNGDFLHPVNQRGKTTYDGTGSKVYTIDRWCTWSNVSGALKVVANGITVAAGAELIQYMPLDAVENGKTYTFCACKADGTVEAVQVAYGASVSGTSINAAWEGTWGVGFALTLSAGTWRWAAMYEGAYTAETLPRFAQRGYAAEYTACCRYYISPVARFATALRFSETVARVSVPLPVPMRAIPTATLLVADNVVFPGNVTAVTGVSVNGMMGATAFLDLTCDLTKNSSYAIGMTYVTQVALSADL